MITNNIRNIQIVSTKIGTKTICINNIFLHSKYDPEKEAANYLDYNRELYENKQYVVVYGLGFGYHIKELLNRISDDCKVYIFDLDYEVVNAAKSIGIIDDILADSRVEIFIKYSRSFYENFQQKIQLVDNIMILNTSVKTLPNTYIEFKELLKGFELSRIAVEKFGNMMMENYKLNINVEYRYINEFIKEQSKDVDNVIVVSAGPSLELCIEELKRNRYKVKIYAVGRALKILMQNDIKPDMVCIIDPQDIVYTNQLKGYEELDIPLCFLNTACHLAVKNYKGPKFMFYNEYKEGLTTINTGKSVATAVLDIAIKTNANPIIFIGQDLAYFNNKTHSGEDECENISTCKKVLGVNGEMLNTTEGLLFFKRWIEETIQKHPEITFINCSGGAKIIGTIEKNLDEIMKII